MLKVALEWVLMSGTEEPLLPVSRVDETRQACETKARHLEKPRRPVLKKALYEVKKR